MMEWDGGWDLISRKVRALKVNLNLDGNEG